MVDLENGLPVGTQERLLASAAPYQSSTTSTQGETPESVTTTASDSRADRPIKDGGRPTTDDAAPPSSTEAALRRLRLAIQQP